MARSSGRGASHTLTIAIVFYITLCVASAYVAGNRGEFPPIQAVRRSPRGGGLSAHRRNCPGGFRKRFSKVTQTEADRTLAEERHQLPVELPPLSALMQNRRRAAMSDDNDDDMTGFRLAAPVRAALLQLLRRERDSLNSGPR